MADPTHSDQQAPLRPKGPHNSSHNSFENALALHQRGQTAEAERVYRQLLGAQPDNVQVLRLLGVLYLQQSEWPRALAPLQAALRLDPAQPAALVNLALAQQRLGQPTAALDCLDRALALAPELTEAHSNRADVLLDLRRPTEALESAERALRWSPHLAVAHANRGRALLALGRANEALESQERALQIEPTSALALNHKGMALRQLGRLDEALAQFDQACKLSPAGVASLFNRGNVLLELGRPGEALENYRELLKRLPSDTEARMSGATALLRLQRPEEALHWLDSALAQIPDHPLALFQRAVALIDLGRRREAHEALEAGPLRSLEHPELLYQRGVLAATSEDATGALAACRRALALRPDYPDALALAAQVGDRLALTDEALGYLDRLLALAPDYPYARGTRHHIRARACDWTGFEAERTALIARVERGITADLPFSFLAVSDSAPAQLACAKTYAAGLAVAAPELPPVSRIPSISGRRTRIAYVSRDLRNHAVARLLVGVFEQHDRTQFETFAILLHPQDSSVISARVRAAFEHFLDFSDLGDSEVVRRLRALEIDLAVDLMGYTEGARPRIFAERVAPVQVSYIGFPGTMGAEFIDYLIADHFVVPHDIERHYAERVVRLPESFQANDNQRELPAPPSRTSLGLPEDAFVWCCLNAHAKLNPAIFEVWMRLLRAQPRSVLWLRGGQPLAEKNLRREAANRGIDPGSLLFAPLVPYEQNLARLSAADLFLDTVPFNGGASANDVLWAGLPLLTVAGEAYAARMAGSLLHALGLPELVTHDLEGYEQRALELAGSPWRLRALRARLESRRKAASALDTARFCRHLERAYQMMVERFQTGERPHGFAVESIAAS